MNSLTADDAEAITLAFWRPKKPEMVKYLRGRGFKSDKSAEKAVTNFIETMAFVARKTRQPMFKAGATGEEKADG